MGGFAGLFSLEGRPIDARELRTLAAACRRPAAATDYWVCGAMGLAVRHRDRVDSDDSALGPVGFAIDGWTDGPQPRRASDLSSFFQANGEFAVALCDSASRSVVLARDPMGARRLHYALVARTLVFASEIKAILAAPGIHAEPDPDAVTDHVLDRWIEPDRTCFLGIHSVPPGHALVATPDGVRTERFWQFDTSTRIRCGSIEEYADAFREVFGRAVRRRMPPGRVAVSVSGGLDSSSVYVQAVHSAGIESDRITGIHLAFPRNTPADEERFVATLDGVGRNPVHRIPHPLIGMLSSARAVVANLETPDVAWEAFDALCMEARGRGCSVLLDGDFGDEVLFPRRYLVDCVTAGSWLTPRRHLRAFSAGVPGSQSYYRGEFRAAVVRGIAPRAVFRAAKRAARARRRASYPACYSRPMLERLLERQLDRYSRRGPSAHHDEYLQWAHSGHGYFNVQRQTTAAAMHGLEIASPFRDRDLIQLLMALPGHVVTWQGTPKGLLRHAMRGVLPEAIRTRAGKADFTHLVNADALQAREAILGALTPRALIAQYGFVDGGALSRAASDMLEAIGRDTAHDSALASWRLFGLVALEYWLQHFFGTGSCTTS